jgi:hypothetical protein
MPGGRAPWICEGGVGWLGMGLVGLVGEGRVWCTLTSSFWRRLLLIAAMVAVLCLEGWVEVAVLIDRSARLLFLLLLLR